MGRFLQRSKGSDEWRAKSSKNVGLKPGPYMGRPSRGDAALKVALCGEYRAEVAGGEVVERLESMNQLGAG
jgi:hypothetical protein